MISDKQFWPGNCPPIDVNQFITWAISDYIDYYNSFKPKEVIKCKKLTQI